MKRLAVILALALLAWPVTLYLIILGVGSVIAYADPANCAQVIEYQTAKLRAAGIEPGVPFPWLVPHNPPRPQATGIARIDDSLYCALIWFD